MTEETKAAAVPQANPHGLMHIGAVAAHNIAAALSLGQEHVGTIEQAIKDEISAMSSHFTLAIADVQTQYEAEVAQAKEREKAAIAEFNAAVAKIRGEVSARVAAMVNDKWAFFALGAGLFLFGALTGWLFTRFV